MALPGQPSERKSRIGLLSAFSNHDVETQACLAAFKHLLERFGWAEGSNTLIDFRFSEGVPGTHPCGSSHWRQMCLWACANPAVTAFQPLTRTIPIVFTQLKAASSRILQDLRQTLPDFTVLSRRLRQVVGVAQGDRTSPSSRGCCLEIPLLPRMLQSCARRISVIGMAATAAQ